VPRLDPPMPVPIPSLSLPPFPSPALPSLTLEVGPLKLATGSGERCELPQQDLGWSPSLEPQAVAVSLYGWLMT